MSDQDSRIPPEALDGVCKWFNPAKGYGWVNGTDDPAIDYFVHYNGIQTEGYRTLSEGQRVRFLPREGPKGRIAFKVWPLP